MKKYKYLYGAKMFYSQFTYAFPHLLAFKIYKNSFAVYQLFKRQGKSNEF